MLLAERRDYLVTDLLERHAERLEDAGRDPLTLAHEAEEQVLGTDVAVAELARLVYGELDDLLGTRREGDLTRRCGRVSATDDELDGRSHLRELNSERVKDTRSNALALTNQTEEEVLRSDVVVVETDGLVLGKREDSFRAVVEAIEWSHCALF
jgi:hypothetical protein